MCKNAKVSDELSLSEINAEISRLEDLRDKVQKNQIAELQNNIGNYFILERTPPDFPDGENLTIVGKLLGMNEYGLTRYKGVEFSDDDIMIVNSDFAFAEVEEATFRVVSRAEAEELIGEMFKRVEEIAREYLEKK